MLGYNKFKSSKDLCVFVNSNNVRVISISLDKTSWHLFYGAKNVREVKDEKGNSLGFEKKPKKDYYDVT